MIEASTPFTLTEQVNFETQRTLSVPRTVASKYDVVNVSETIEQLITSKIDEDSRDKEEAFYFVDLGAVIKRYALWTKHLPRVKPFYAVKCNPNNAIVQTLAGLGVNFDCASSAEISQVLGSNVAASRIIYANPTKMKSHIKFAKSSGVELMTFDNADELKKVAEAYPEAKLVLRIITDDSQSVCRFSTKFGAPMHVVPSLLSLAKEMNLNLVGVSFHVGSGCMSVKSFESAIKSAHEVFEMAKKVGFGMTLLDLGGGWPGTDDDKINFSHIADHIRPLLDELFPTTELIAEPGRFFVAQSHTLVVNVFAKRIVEAEEKQFLYYINDGVYQSFNCIFFDHSHPEPLVFTGSERRDASVNVPSYKCTIFGPTCDSMDCIAKDILLPELHVGDFLYFKNMGAYTTAAASPFNGFRSCPTTYYINSW